MGAVLGGPKEMWKNDSKPMVPLVVLGLLITVYALRRGGATVSCVPLSKPTDYAFLKTSVSGVSELPAFRELDRSARIRAVLDNVLSTPSVSDFLDRLSSLGELPRPGVPKINEVVPLSVGEQEYGKSSKEWNDFLLGRGDRD